MQYLQEMAIQCPYCGEVIELLIDGSVPQQSYIEDCQVCCCPIHLDITITDDRQTCIVVRHENE
ncbi:MAG: CPXCG motif-containing cysteine-rich protein [Gammaproteobacteria bacterium]|nr:CPXCG motif-containing cysteine-rich protein [Gammaproteobacteria bacterium]